MPSSGDGRGITANLAKGNAVVTLVPVPSGLGVAGGHANTIRRLPQLAKGRPRLQRTHDLRRWRFLVLLPDRVTGRARCTISRPVAGFSGNGGLRQELLTHKPVILLLSGGRNDLPSDREKRLQGGGRPLRQYLGCGFRKVMNGVIRDLEWVARKSVKTVTTKELAIIFNGYDKAVAAKRVTGCKG